MNIQKIVYIGIVFIYYGLSSCTQKEELSPQKGFLFKNSYYNQFLNWTMPVEKGWDIMSEIEKSTRHEDLFLLNSSENVIGLIRCQKDKLNSFKAVFDFNDYPQIDDEEDYLESTMDLLGTFYSGIGKLKTFNKNINDSLKLEGSEQIIGGLEFKVVKASYREAFRSLGSILFVKKINSGFLTISISYTREEEKKYFLDFFEKSSFSNFSFPSDYIPKNLPLDSLPDFFQKEADKMISSICNEDYLSYYEYMYPRVIMELKEEIPDFNRRVVQTMIKEVYSFENIRKSNLYWEVQKPDSIISFNNLHVAIVTTKMEVEKDDSDNVIVLRNSFFAVFSELDQKVFFLDNSLLSFNVLAYDIPRHFLRRLVSERDYLKETETIETGNFSEKARAKREVKD